MILIVPFRLMVSILCFLYLILPIIFHSSIREVLGLEVPELEYYLLGIVYSLLVFIILFFLPKNIYIKNINMNRKLSTIVILLTIFLSFYFFVDAFLLVKDFDFYDKVQLHLIYENINTEYSLRFKYNILLCLTLLFGLNNNVKYLSILFFFPPVLFELLFSKHNYITHLLIYGFILMWNTNINKKRILGFFTMIVIVLMIIRFTLYSSYQDDIFKLLASILGEFTISWQSIIEALKYDGPKELVKNEWYSDILSRQTGLNIGLAGNPVSESIFYFNDASSIFLLFITLLFVVISYKIRNNYSGSLSLLVIVFYMRDIFRTGFLFGILIFIKVYIIFFVIEFVSNKLKGYYCE